MRNLVLISKQDSPRAWGTRQEIAARAIRRGFSVIEPPQNWEGKAPVTDYLAFEPTPWPAEFLEAARGADLVIAIGGDGTLLHAARLLMGTSVPLIGINEGNLGFLTELSKAEVESAFKAILDGHYTIERRVVLNALVNDEKNSSFAINDVVLSGQGRLAQFDVRIDNKDVFSIRADGLIIATPTGSTAYALSANGPIMHPSLDAFAIVPNTPHSLTARPVVVSGESKIEITVHGRYPVRLDCDGVSRKELLTKGDVVEVSKASCNISLLHMLNHNFYSTLQAKLNWATPLAD